MEGFGEFSFCFGIPYGRLGLDIFGFLRAMVAQGHTDGYVVRFVEFWFQGMAMRLRIFLLEVGEAC